MSYRPRRPRAPSWESPPFLFTSPTVSSLPNRLDRAMQKSRFLFSYRVSSLLGEVRGADSLANNLVANDQTMRLQLTLLFLSKLYSMNFNLKTSIYLITYTYNLLHTTWCRLPRHFWQSGSSWRLRNLTSNSSSRVRSMLEEVWGADTAAGPHLFVFITSPNTTFHSMPTIH